MTVGPNPKEFLPHGYRPNANNCIPVMKLLASANALYVDCNFARVPNIFKQIYIIHVPLGDIAVTSVYTLFPNKPRANYEELLQAIVGKCVNQSCFLNVQTKLTNFEDSALSDVLAVFSRDVETNGFCHPTQCIWYKIQELGFDTQHNTNAEFRLFCGMINAPDFLLLEGIKFPIP